MSSTPTIITDFALINALGATVDQNLDALRAGTGGLKPNKIALPFETYTGAISIDLPELSPELSGWATRSGRILTLLVRQLDASLQKARQRWRPERIAIILGTSTAGADKTEEAYKEFVNTGALPDDYDLWRHHTYGSMLRVVGEQTGATGPAWMLSTACTSSAKPLASARRLIELDIIDAAIVGGVDTLCSMTLQGFNSLGALSHDICKPFSTERRGINIGEGGALLLVERDGEARGLIEAVGESSDAYHIAAPHPQGEGATLAMQRALDEAGIQASDIDHINAHGTGTTLNDSAEATAIARLFGDSVPVISTKGFTGHTLGGAGATEAAFALICLEHGFIPPSLGADPIDENIGIQIAQDTINAPIKRVLSNSFAFGGNNISVLLRSA